MDDISQNKKVQGVHLKAWEGGGGGGGCQHLTFAIAHMCYKYGNGY